MKVLPSFRLHRPTSLSDALSIVATHGPECRLLAGGTDLVVNLRNEIETPAHVLALGALSELRGVDLDDSGELRIGALATIGEVAAHPAIAERFDALSKAAATVSGPTLRAMGTVGGNLCLDTRCHWFNQSFEWRRACGFCLKKDGDICHVARSSPICVATSCGDLAPALLTLDARVVLRSASGDRVVPLDEFYVDDGTTKFKLAADEILTEVRVPPTSAGRRSYYGKLRVRGAIDYPLAGIAISANGDGPAGRNVRVALTAVGPRPFRVAEVERLLSEGPLDDDRIDEAAELVYRAANPLKTGGMYPPGYRRLRIRLFAREGLRQISDGARP